MAKQKITQLVERELAPFLAECGCELYHLEYVKEGKEWYLRVYIERQPEEPGQQPGNVSVDDCETVSRFLSARLDELDPIEQNYYLEVSSPGMDRPLIKEKDFERYRGELVDLSLYQAVEGKKAVTGRLVGLMDGRIVIRDEKGKEMSFPVETVSKTRLTVVF